MAFDVVLMGSLMLSEDRVEEWLSSPIVPESFHWLEDLGGTDSLHETPEALLSFLTESCLLPHEVFELHREGGMLRLDAYVSEDAYRETSTALALLFASAAAFQGQGELLFYGYQGIRFGERIRVADGEAQLMTLSLSEMERVEISPRFDVLDSKIHQRFDTLVGRAQHSERTQLHPFTGR
jgi:hypothetical protein